MSTKIALLVCLLALGTRADTVYVNGIDISVVTPSDLTAITTNAAPLPSYLNTSNAVGVLQTNTAPLQSYLSTSNSLVVLNSNLTSTATGNEGVRYVGALGGYTLEEFIEDTATRGPARDMPVFTYQTQPVHDLTVSWSAGDIYDPVNGYFHLVPGTTELVDNSVNYAYWDVTTPTQVKWTSGIRPNANSNIYLATFSTVLGVIVQKSITVPVGDILLTEDVAFADTMPSLITQGMNVYPTGTNRLDIAMASGTEYQNLSDKIEHGSLSLAATSNMTAYCHTGGVAETVVITVSGITTNTDTNTLVVSAAADPGANQFYCWDGNASHYTGLTNSDYWIAYTGLWQAFYQGNNFASRPPGQPVTGTWEFAQLTAEYGSTYTTNYTYTTNLASVVAGKALGSISNASINGIMGTVSGGISRLTVALPSVPVADGFSILDRSGVWSVADWLQNGFLAERYYVWRIDDGDGLGLVDGSGYWFDDQAGLLAAQSTNQVWANPGYKNSLLTDGWAFHSQQSAGKMTSASISMPSGDTSWTVSVWLYMQAVGGWAPWIWFGDGNGTRDPAGSFMVRGWASDDFVLGHDNGGGDAPYWQLYDASTWQATTGQWVHCVFQYDASTSFEYFWTNGYLRASNALSFDMTWSGSGVFYLSSNPFGETPPDNFWDDCAFFSRCITPSEVATLYGGGSGFSPGTTNVAPFNDGLLAYWPMNEGAGTSTEDIGPQGADGTFSGGTAYWVASPYGASSIFSSNMTVACTNRLLNFVPSNARVSALIDSTGGVPTTNIVKVLASRDLGTTWTAAVISQIETWSVSNYLYVGMCSLTNQPSGSNVTVKVVVTNSPLTVRVYGVAAPCAP